LGGFSILHEFGWIGLLLVLFGLVACWQRQRPFVVACVTAVLCFWGMIVGVFNPQPESIFLTEEFYTPLYLLTAVLIAIGLHAVLSQGLKATERPQRHGWQHQALVLAFLLLVPVFQLSAQYRANDQHSNYIAQDYAVNTLRSLPEQAVLFSWGDSGAFPLWYLQGVERLREDVDLPHIPHLVFGWYRRELPRLQAAFELLPDTGMTAEQVFGQLAERLIPERPVLVDYSTRYSLTWGNREPVPFGMVFRLSARRAERLAGEATVWELLALHRLGAEQVWQIDQDSHKAVLIMAHSLLQAAEQAAHAGQREQAGGMLAVVYRMVPSWRDSIVHLQRRYNLPMQGRGELQ
jgi:hypothetical protein